jgi:hypothetical protein
MASWTQPHQSPDFYELVWVTGGNHEEGSHDVDVGEGEVGMDVCRDG